MSTFTAVIADKYHQPFKTEVYLRGAIDGTSYLATIQIKNEDGSYELIQREGSSIPDALHNLAYSLSDI